MARGSASTGYESMGAASTADVSSGRPNGWEGMKKDDWLENVVWKEMEEMKESKHDLRITKDSIYMIADETDL